MSNATSEFSTRRNGFTTLMLAALLICTLVACLDPASAHRAALDRASHDVRAQKLTGTIELTGSSTLGPLAAEIGKRFEALHPGVRVNVQTGGSSRGIVDATKGLADIGMTSRPLRDAERAGLVEWRVAMDGVCLIVNSDNQVTTLEKVQLVKIMKGEITNWKQVGGRDLEITFINRASGRSELQLISEYFSMSVAEFRPDLIAGENQQALKMVASNPAAITYLSLGAAHYESQNGAPIRLLPLDGIEASFTNVANGRFPLARPLLFVTKPQPSPLVKRLIEFAQSSDVHDLVRELSYVPVQD